MSNKIKILIGSALASIVLLVVSFLVNPRRETVGTKIPTPTILLLPTNVIVPTRGVTKYSSNTGALYISPTDSDFTEIWLISNLRNKMPIITPVFKIDYDYKTDKFVVNLKDNTTADQQLFSNWLKAAGYDRISQQYFTIQ